MSFFEVVVLLGFLLVFSKAPIAPGDEAIFDKAELGGTTGDETFDEEPDIAAGEEVLEDEAEKNDKRQIFPPRPPIRRIVTVPIAIPPNANRRFFKLCYCFRRRRRCYGKKVCLIFATYC